MLYTNLITILRRELHDFDKIARDTFNGDASSTLFALSYPKIKDASYTVTIGGVTKTEVTDYEIDKDSGLITFTSAPASGTANVVVVYKYNVLRDADYIAIWNDALDYFQERFWEEQIDSTTLTTVLNQYEYSLDTVSTEIMHVINVWYKSSTNATNWNAVQGVTNWKFYPESNKIATNPPFSSSSLPIKIMYLKKFTKGTVVGSTQDVPEKYMLPYKYYAKARYFEYIAPERIFEVGAVVTVPGFLPGTNILNVSEYFYKKAEEIANKIAPKFPPIIIKTIQEWKT